MLVSQHQEVVTQQAIVGRPHHKHRLVQVVPVRLDQDQDRDPGNRNPQLERAVARRKERVANGDPLMNMQIKKLFMIIKFISLFIRIF